MTALIALPVLALLIVCAGPELFTAFVSLVTALALHEFFRMGLGDSCRLEQWFAACCGGVAIPLALYSAPGVFISLAVFFVLILLSLFLFRFNTIESVHHQLGWVVLGMVYLAFSMGHLAAIRALPYGREWIFLCLLIIMGCDSFAYFIGRKLGRRKLYEAVSPNKSIEGALGGLLGAVCAVLIGHWTFMPFLGMVNAVLIGLLLGTAGQVGDLFESLLKRACQVKDSGNLIPGHGGLLDRLDSLLFAFPLVYYIASFGYGG